MGSPDRYTVRSLTRHANAPLMPAVGTIGEIAKRLGIVARRKMDSLSIREFAVESPLVKVDRRQTLVLLEEPPRMTSIACSR